MLHVMTGMRLVQVVSQKSGPRMPITRSLAAVDARLPPVCRGRATRCGSVGAQRRLDEYLPGDSPGAVHGVPLVARAFGARGVASRRIGPDSTVTLSMGADVDALTPTWPQTDGGWGPMDMSE